MKNCFRIEKIFIFFLYGLCEAFLQTANTPCEKKNLQNRIRGNFYFL